ncbi:MAG: glutathione S-transferase N-terminal domain-containing protein [Steroidobacteraceae bacterium]
MLFSRSDLWSHRTRLVIAEKGLPVELVDIQGGNLPEDLLDLNPYNSVPTLVDRNLVLYDSRIIIEYLDERFPHPPLMPIDPIMRAQFRLAMYRIERDWYSLGHQMITPTDYRLDQATARKALHDSIAASADVFKAKPYFLSDELTLVDATIAPILWRLRSWQIDMPPAIERYANRIYSRPAFRRSLSSIEREIHV